MDNSFNDMLQICRTCLKEITDKSFLYLDCTSAANTQLTIRQKLHICIPELDLSFAFNSVICSKCVANLVSAYELKKNCLQSEIQINKYIQQVQHNGDVNLVEVVGFQQSNVTTLDIEIKMEDFFEITENFKNENLICNKFLAGKRFRSDEEVKVAVNGYFESLEENHFREGIEKLEHRWTKCINLKGDYVEK